MCVREMLFDVLVEFILMFYMAMHGMYYKILIEVLWGVPSLIWFVHFQHSIVKWNVRMCELLCIVFVIGCVSVCNRII